MGAAFDGRCYASTTLAKEAFYQSQPASLTGPDSAGYTYKGHYVNQLGVWKYQVTKMGYAVDVPAQVINLYTVTSAGPTFSSCDESTTFADGVVLGWGVALAMILAWGVTYLRRFL